MKVQNENQHYLPKYRLKKFAGKDGIFFVYNKETGKIIHVGANAKGIAAENNLYEYPELEKWNECYRGKIEKGLLSNDIENSALNDCVPSNRLRAYPQQWLPGESNN